MNGHLPRQKLPGRRRGITETLIFEKGKAGELKFHATYNWEEGGRVREFFIDLPFKEGTNMRVLMKSACILASIALQRGATMHDFARTLGEDDRTQAPRDLMGLIVRAGATIDEQRGFTAGPPDTQPPASAAEIPLTGTA